MFWFLCETFLIAHAYDNWFKNKKATKTRTTDLIVMGGFTCSNYEMHVILHIQTGCFVIGSELFTSLMNFMTMLKIQTEYFDKRCCKDVRAMKNPTYQTSTYLNTTTKLYFSSLDFAVSLSCSNRESFPSHAGYSPLYTYVPSVTTNLIYRDCYPLKVCFFKEMQKHLICNRNLIC